jgi:hypothetical protein
MNREILAFYRHQLVAQFVSFSYFSLTTDVSRTSWPTEAATSGKKKKKRSRPFEQQRKISFKKKNREQQRKRRARQKFLPSTHVTEDAVPRRHGRATLAATFLLASNGLAPRAAPPYHNLVCRTEAHVPK